MPATACNSLHSEKSELERLIEAKEPKGRREAAGPRVGCSKKWAADVGRRRRSLERKCAALAASVHDIPLAGRSGMCRERSERKAEQSKEGRQVERTAENRLKG